MKESEAWLQVAERVNSGISVQDALWLSDASDAQWLAMRGRMARVFDGAFAVQTAERNARTLACCLLWAITSRRKAQSGRASP